MYCLNDWETGFNAAFEGFRKKLCQSPSCVKENISSFSSAIISKMRRSYILLMIDDK